jgi:hypothetical protein
LLIAMTVLRGRILGIDTVRNGGVFARADTPSCGAVSPPTLKRVPAPHQQTIGLFKLQSPVS